MEQILGNSAIGFWIGIILVFLIIISPLSSKIRNRRLLKKVSSINRGTKSERDLIIRLLKNGIHPDAIYHDLWLSKQNGKLAQIDLVVARPQGIIVFEVKDYSGWIFGSANYTNWTKVLAYGNRKYRFYNPIKQNKNHINTLKSQLKQFKNIPFYSIIVFYGDCELKEINYVPKDTYLVKSHRVMEVVNKIEQNNDQAPYTDKREIMRFLEQAAEKGHNAMYQNQHKDNIDDMLGKDRIYN